MKYLIVNADDFGYARGVNEGIIAAYENGIVRSTSLMVDMPLAHEAVALAKSRAGLGVGLHFAVTDTQGPKVDLCDVAAVEKELHRQYQRCCDLLGQKPTHIDSHHHVHMRKELLPLLSDWASAQQLPLRSAGTIQYNGGFYGQWYDEAWQPHPALEFIGVNNLEKILRKLPDGVTELACHPAYFSPDLDSSYASERTIELMTLLDPRVLTVVQELGIMLANFATLPLLMSNDHVAA